MIDDDVWLNFMKEQSESTGEIKAGLKNNYQYIGKVSEKVDDLRNEHDSHASSLDAHGVGAARRVRSDFQSIALWTGKLTVGALALYGAIWAAL